MVNAVMYKAHGVEDRFPAGPRVLLSWFQSGRNQLGVVTVLRNLTSSC